MSALIHSYTKTQLDDLLGAKKTWSARLVLSPRPTGFRAFASAAMTNPEQNVMGVGVGEKFSGGHPTGVLAVKFLVRRKYAADELSQAEKLPQSVDGLPVDVEEVGVFRAFKKKPQIPPVIPNPKKRYRLAQPFSGILALQVQDLLFGRHPQANMRPA